ncbi:MAG UNVERIFIED_CONTAM: hypothetical protein LVR29_34685 [Microcystis novacekii LVE1205-3]
MANRVKIYNPTTATVDLSNTPDGIDIDIEGFNRTVVTESFNQVVCEQELSPVTSTPSLPGKTLIYAATDAHADLVVNILTKAFETAHGPRTHRHCGKASLPLPTNRKNTIRRFKNEPNR